MNINFFKGAGITDKKHFQHMPQHIAFIPDGNNRWAKKRSLPKLAGHRQGVERVKETIKTCLNLGIKTVSFFAFSSENWQRPKAEVSNLMNLFSHLLAMETRSLKKNYVRLKIIGDISKLSSKLQDKIANSQRITEQDYKITVIIAINYGGMWDLTSAMRKVAHKISNGLLNPEDINAQLIEDNLSTKDFPAPDLLIRTSGEKRLSNFMIWQCAYSELYFSDKLWPDFDSKELIVALDSFSNRERRFGMNSEQVRV